MTEKHGSSSTEELRNIVHEICVTLINFEHTRDDARICMNSASTLLSRLRGREPSLSKKQLSSIYEALSGFCLELSRITRKKAEDLAGLLPVFRFFISMSPANEPNVDFSIRYGLVKNTTLLLLSYSEFICQDAPFKSRMNYSAFWTSILSMDLQIFTTSWSAASPSKSSSRKNLVEIVKLLCLLSDVSVQVLGFTLGTTDPLPNQAKEETYLPRLTEEQLVENIIPIMQILFFLLEVITVSRLVETESLNRYIRSFAKFEGIKWISNFIATETDFGAQKLQFYSKIIPLWCSTGTAVSVEDGGPFAKYLPRFPLQLHDFISRFLKTLLGANRTAELLKETDEKIAYFACFMEPFLINRLQSEYRQLSLGLAVISQNEKISLDKITVEECHRLTFKELNLFDSLPHQKVIQLIVSVLLDPKVTGVIATWAILARLYSHVRGRLRMPQDQLKILTGDVKRSFENLKRSGVDFDTYISTQILIHNPVLPKGVEPDVLKWCQELYMKFLTTDSKENNNKNNQNISALDQQGKHGPQVSGKAAPQDEKNMSEEPQIVQTDVGISSSASLTASTSSASIPKKDCCENCGLEHLAQQGDQVIKLLTCARCKIVHYCSRECQRAHWKNGHKQSCTPTTSI